MEAWKLGRVGVWVCGRFGSSESFESMTVWKFARLEDWSMEVWKVGRLAVWQFGSSGSWKLGMLEAWKFGCVDV